MEKRNIWSTGRGGRKTDEENILIFSLKAKYNIWSAEEENILEKENVTPVTTEEGLRKVVYKEQYSAWSKTKPLFNFDFNFEV